MSSLSEQGEVLASQADTSLERRDTSLCLGVSGALYWLTQSVFFIRQAGSCFQPSISTKSEGAPIPTSDLAVWGYDCNSCNRCTETCRRTTKFCLADFPLYSKEGCVCLLGGLTLIWQSNTQCRIPAAAHLQDSPRSVVTQLVLFVAEM